MNFIEEFKKGQQGANKGLPMGEGLANVSHAINGIQKGMLIGVAAAPKVGKSTLVDNGFVIQPYLESLRTGKKLEFVYFSLEIDRISKEFDYAAYFLADELGVEAIRLEEGSTFEGNNVIPMSSTYLRGRLTDDQGNTILVKPTVQEALKQVYSTHIIRLFGEYAEDGTLLKQGMIRFSEHRDNPTGIRNYLNRYADVNGRWTKQIVRGKNRKDEEKKDIEIKTGYVPRDPDKHVIVIMDHLRKLDSERGMQKKQVVDKMVEYFVEFRNLCKWTIIGIIHLNRAMTDPYRLKMYGDLLFPNGDDVKDTGNFSEECDHLFTMFNPNDERYNLSKHFGNVIKDKEGNVLYPNMRTIHLVESRHVYFPQHFRVNMYGNTKQFEQLNIRS